MNPEAGPLRFSLFTLFPELLLPFTQEALLGKAARQGLLAFDVIQLRDFAGNRHHKVDSPPAGGGAGMVIRVDVVERALASLPTPPDEVILLTPAGQPFTQRLAEQLSERQHLALLCGRYEGFDTRVERLATREVSIGDYVMMGGEAAAACIVEAVGRLRPGVIGDAESHRADSFSSGLLDYPEYTRPPVWQDETIPEVLLGGNHAAIERWRRDQALARTLARRPDLLPNAGLSPEDSRTLLALGATVEQLQHWHAPPPPSPKRRRRSPSSSPL
ncbi:tRNA (guanosine(37)-N1)-methyltransferase TrmD [Deinococcus sonorensis]|uniref:tRNA (guanine-N(1)-)-methyltransferase n=2 Tax=Deinococcus sonorensis TaxID=309891 RepID=A0AAU7UCW1_9DEIO